METIERRSPDVVMRLDRMGSFHQSRLSFMRILMRRMAAEAWTFDRPLFEIDADGVGTALYSAHTPDRTYTLVAFAHDLPDDQRSDRVIATAWDTTFTLHDGVPTADDIARLRANVPLQEVGRVSGAELTLSRANRSVRLWSKVIDALADGRQPDVADVEDVGYLMRTTAVYGSGKFGAADRDSICDRAELVAPFQAEMLTVYLIRTFVADLVEHMAIQRSPNAVTLAPDIRRRFGIGNSTGLGMAPFLIKHPRLINNWIAAREEALRRVRSVEHASDAEQSAFRSIITRSRLLVDSWRSEHEIQVEKLADLNVDLDRLDSYLAAANLGDAFAWNSLVSWSESKLSLEGQELVVSTVLEPYGHLVDELVEEMHAEESAPIRVDGSTSVAEIRQLLETQYAWDIDFESEAACKQFWYVSEEKLEPRLGERHDEPVGPFEQPLQPGRDAARMHADLVGVSDRETLGHFLRAHPEHRHVARRVLLSERLPYAEIRDNTIASSMLPIDLLRAKLSFFGATRFDPRSDRWVRITMFQGAPYPDELATADPDAWGYPVAAA